MPTFLKLAPSLIKLIGIACCQMTLTKGIIRSIRKRNTIFKAARASNSSTQLAKYRKLKVTNMIRKAKASF